MRLLRLIAVMTVCIGSGCAWQPLFTQPAPLSPDEQLDELVRTIDCNPDILHSDYTPSVRKLIELGDPAIPRMLDLMLLDGPHDGFTREHAQTVLYGIMIRKHGFASGQGWRDPEGHERARALWKTLGDLNWEAPYEERERAVNRWREWLAKGQP